MEWVKKKPDTWACLDSGEWKSQPTALFDTHDTRSLGMGKVEFFVPDAVIVEGPTVLNPGAIAYRLFLSKLGEWRGPFTSLATAKEAAEMFNPVTKEIKDEGSN